MKNNPDSRIMNLDWIYLQLPSLQGFINLFWQLITFYMYQVTDQSDLMEP